MKELWVATDFYDDVCGNGRGYTPHQIRALMRYAKSLGATTSTWIVDDMWTLYDIVPGGRDLLAEVIEAAHAEGLRFHAVYKPFEGGLDNIELPHTAPRPEGAIFWEDLRGLLPITRPFVAAHPEMCMQRWPGDEDPGGALASIRLTKDDDAPVTLEAADLSIWTSAVNGRFQPSHHPFTVTQSCGWEPNYPMGRTCRSVWIKGLSIPPDQRYVEVRLGSRALNGQAFRNEYRPEVVSFVVDRFADACRDAKIPLVYQSHRRYYTRQDLLAFHPDRIACLRQEMAYVAAHPGVRGYEFYETAGFTKIDERGEFRGNAQFFELATEFAARS